MDQLYDFKCPNCGGTVEFDGSLQKMKCPYCESVFKVDDFKKPEEAVEEWTEDTEAKQRESTFDGAWDYREGKSWDKREEQELATYTCQSCGGQVIGEASEGAGRCPYCGNNIVMKSQFRGEFKPDYVIPFTKTKKDAVESLQKYIKKSKFVPMEYKSQRNIQEIRGVYIPFWTYSSTAEFDMTYTAHRVSAIWREGDYQCEKHDAYRVQRQGTIQFEDVPADASSHMPDEMMDRLEPYDMHAAVDFQPAYLAGYLAERYDLKADECVDRANSRMEYTAKAQVSATVDGYHTVTYNNGRFRMNDQKIKYVLMPVWMLSNQWNGETYTFAMNGQTGKVTGRLPVDKGAFRKIWLQNSLISSVIISLLLLMISYFF
ncbi:MAG: hypothetical protein PUF13_10925 [Lachnospiraceae bacterium]|nr:hypothetical protein [Lachnospiraceae bacterium]